MQRRQFLAAGLATAVASQRLIAERLPRDVKITRIVGFTLPSRRPKLVGKNSRLDVHGDRAIDVLQGDMRRFGFGGILTEADWARAQGLLVAPHNWGSLVGFYMQLHVGRAITNLYRAEQDPLSSDLLIAEGYRIEDGKCTVPDAPGFGLKLDDEKLRRQKMAFDLKL